LPLWFNLFLCRCPFGSPRGARPKVPLSLLAYYWPADSTFPNLPPGFFEAGRGRPHYPSHIGGKPGPIKHKTSVLGTPLGGPLWLIGGLWTIFEGAMGGPRRASSLCPLKFFGGPGAHLEPWTRFPVSFFRGEPDPVALGGPPAAHGPSIPPPAPGAPTQGGGGAAGIGGGA